MIIDKSEKKRVNLSMTLHDIKASISQSGFEIVNEMSCCKSPPDTQKGVSVLSAQTGPPL